MKSTLKVYFSTVNTDPKEIYKLKLAVRKTTHYVEFLHWDGDPVTEKQVIAHLLMTYQKQLVAQSKTIENFTTPVMTWANPDGSLDIRVGVKDILEAL